MNRRKEHIINIVFVGLIMLTLIADYLTNVSCNKSNPPPMIIDGSHYNDTIWMDSNMYITNIVINRKAGSVIFVPMPWDTLKYKP